MNWMPTICQYLFKCLRSSRDRALYLGGNCSLFRNTENKQIHII